MKIRTALKGSLVAALAVSLAIFSCASLKAQQVSPSAPAVKAPVHAEQVKRLLIRNAMVIYGNAEPAFGPTNICVENGLIARVGSVPRDWVADAEIDATGKYVMPGIVCSHMHLQDERAGIPQPIQYELNLYLAAGSDDHPDVRRPTGLRRKSGAPRARPTRWSRRGCFSTSASGAEGIPHRSRSSARACAMRRKRELTD